ncbi:MAG: arginyltransferase [Proteobacteria bacterium]|jgi:arginine-tRNA-protein transferase|nr:arginyltransferase [Alphaproteobacteria bacterium]NCC04093.1 arginyltransferase [Pseudomonadota bacterium]
MPDDRRPLGHELPFYYAEKAPCPYLPGQIERKLFVQLTGLQPSNDVINACLVAGGFRRSLDILYRPACEACHACRPVRVNAPAFCPSRSQKRVIKRNKDLYATLEPISQAGGLYPLFRVYMEKRHAQSEMAIMDEGMFQDMLHPGLVTSYALILRHKGTGEVKGCMLVDDVGEGMSAVYSFFDPTQPARSLGHYLIISLIEAVRQNGKKWAYLGYAIEGVPNMSYKLAYKPREIIP